MAVEKVNSSSSLAEVIDRILDKGIVIDAGSCSLVGKKLSVESKAVVIASVETYLKYAEAVGLTAQASASFCIKRVSTVNFQRSDHLILLF
ncbi:gas vesicle protein GvpJ [Limnospira fusiformis PMC 851.14]|uniref:Gas vesicle protein GvpJ n=1 Tax=Limnospira fusiformis PMC 851.14 TaxID=2219512 RepID=A0ABU9EF19_LIMFS